MGLLDGIFRKSRKKIHGHELIKKHENKIASQIRAISEQPYIYEVGSQRKAGSTLYLSQLATQVNALFYTLDLNEETTKQARKIVKSINAEFEALNGFGEELLKQVETPIHLLYLDAFDIEGDWHPDELKNWYENKGVSLDNENCWKMHLECIENSLPNLPLNSFVAFDDVNPVNENHEIILDKVDSNHALWSGKGHTAIPFMLNNGFTLIDNQRSAALFQRTSI